MPPRSPAPSPSATVILTLATGAILAACGSRGALGPPTDSGLDGSSTQDEESIPERDDAECTIAIRVDQCCSAAQPVLSSSLDPGSDPCLVPFISSPFPAREIPQVCQDQWPDGCLFLSCTWSGPLSRLVERSPEGSCQWKTECDPELFDCSWGVDLRRCCGCGEAIPPELPLVDPCIASIEEVWESWPDNPPGCAEACATGFNGCDKDCYSPPPGLIPCIPQTAAPGIARCHL